jgi:cytochrome c oxidase cbb3-type subunit 3
MWKMAQLAKTQEQVAVELEAKRTGNTAWGRLMKQLTDAKPVEAEGDILLDHDYDGIKELDNNLPPWWLYGFYITIIFSFVYLGIYEVFKVWPDQTEEYAIEMKVAEEQLAKAKASNKNLIDESNVTLLTDDSSLGVAAKLYTSSCAACHGDKGQGLVGPNLTDEYWLHGGSLKDIFSTIKYGVPAKGMIAWKNSLNAGQIQKLSSYIVSLQGTNPAGAKAAEGDKYEAAAE